MLVVHTAFSKVAPVDDGPRGLIDALRALLWPDGTLVMPSMTDDDDWPFDPASSPCAGMGIVADTFWRMPGGSPMRLLFPPLPVFVIDFTICETILNCFSSALTSWVVVPLPWAMRSRRDPLMIDGSRRSSGVIEQMIASMRPSSDSSTSA